LRRAQGGDQQAFHDLYQLHADLVFRRLTRLVGPVPEREDLMQEVFLRAYRGLGSFRGESAFSTWLYRVVVNQAYNHLRWRRRHPHDWQASPELDRLVDEHSSPETTARQRQRLERVLSLLDRLKPRKRVAFLLRVVDGLSMAEIAEIVDTTPAAAGQRVRHAQRELQRLVERERRKWSDNEGL
jgi:RNA polymerase sigma-70 factor (ECF subfamily)